MTRAVELLVGDERAQVIEADIARPAVTRTTLVWVRAFFRRRRIFAFLFHLVGYRRRWWRRWRWRWLRTLSNFGLSIHLHLAGDFLGSRSWGRFRRRQNRFVIEYARYVILFLQTTNEGIYQMKMIPIEGRETMYACKFEYGMTRVPVDRFRVSQSAF